MTAAPVLAWTDVAAVLARAEADVDHLVPHLDGAPVHQRFDGKYTITFELTDYTEAFDLALALELIAERDTAPCQITWARVKPVNGKYAVVRVVCVETRTAKKGVPA